MMQHQLRWDFPSAGLLSEFPKAGLRKDATLFLDDEPGWHEGRAHVVISNYGTPWPIGATAKSPFTKKGALRKRMVIDGDKMVEWRRRRRQRRQVVPFSIHRRPGRGR